MTLSKQLFSIITFIFIIIFLGNFVITVSNTKDYLEQESSTKAQDTAVSLGMLLKTLISDKKDPEITSTINIISDSGFYKSILLEDLYYTFNDKELLEHNNKIKGLDWDIQNISIDKDIGMLVVSSEEDLESQLNELEDIQEEPKNTEVISDKTYTLIATDKFKDGDTLKISYDILKNGKKINTYSELTLSKKLVEVKRNIKFDDVPQWFIDFIDLSLPPMKSEINDGWKTTAVVYVTPNPGIAYKKLYEQLTLALIYSIFAFVLAIVLLYIFLHFVLKPLKNIENLAIEISKGTFEQITDIPWSVELKNVSLAMNNMSSKIEKIIKGLNNNIQSINTKLSSDGLTKLPLKQTYETDIKNLFMEKSKGYVYLVKISNLVDYAKANGNRDVDTFIKKVAIILNSFENSQAYRFFGSEFVVVFKNITESENNNIIKKIQNAFDELSDEINKLDIAHIGIVSFNHFDTNASILSNVSQAYEMAKQVGPNRSYIKKNDEKMMGAMKWRETVVDIINNEKFTIDYIGGSKNDDKLVIQEAFATIKDDADELLPIGTFISVAQENDLAIQFDRIVIKKVIEYIKNNNIKHKIIINLSLESILDFDFLNYIDIVINENKDISNNFVFSLTAYSVAINKDAFKKFCEFVKVRNSNVMIKRYEIKFITIDDIKNIKPSFIRLSRDYTTNITVDDNKKALVDSISKVAEILDIKIFAENTNEESDYKFLNDLNIYTSIN